MASRLAEILFVLETHPFIIPELEYGLTGQQFRPPDPAAEIGGPASKHAQVYPNALLRSFRNPSRPSAQNEAYVSCRSKPA